MGLSIFATILVLAVVLAAGTAKGRRWFERNYRHGIKMTKAVMIAGTGLVAWNALCAFLPHPPWASDLCIATTLLFVVIAAATVERFRIRPMAVKDRRVILAIGAHPDDLEIACGGTLAKLVDAGHEVHTLVMSHGAVGGDVQLRPGEARNGASFMGVTGVQVCNLPDTNLAAHTNELVAVIEARINEVKPDMVFTHSENDHHQDHHAVHLATLRAARRHSSILCFESPSATRRFNPAVFVDIEDYLDVKVHAVAQHKNQAGKPYMGADSVRGVAAFRGAQAKQRFAEGFEPVRMLGSSIAGL
ncbi:PIG-L deacetylase family protein [Paeniglutamicibacter kerguelensis]|uniref:LmbE family N-acetylglucosaminyl deacetylase n=1 Tax=Paeniglutamicibacter kerguelensis TaxID=254788 RepID=A0ABS4X9D9_9MICC|nr:PIG-L deacetylase family protein [Paeniglutamicibacter kerguelensis]MBP2385085.1 LmbE family N-acetylglucosaminyl deacetylase [Paeniglutamicibacter kerguelensis]